MKVNNAFKTAAVLLFMSGTMALNAQTSGSDEFKGIAKGNGLIGILPGASFNDDGDGIPALESATPSQVGILLRITLCWV